MKKNVTTESNDFFASDSDGCNLSSHASLGGVKEFKNSTNYLIFWSEVIWPLGVLEIEFEF